MEYLLDLPNDRKLLLSIDNDLSFPIRRMFANILKDAVDTIKTHTNEENDDINKGWFYFYISSLYPHLNKDTTYNDSIDMISSLFDAIKKTTLIWFHEDKDKNKIYDGWAPLIAEISWFDENWMMQYNISLSVYNYLSDRLIAPWVIASLEKPPFPKII